MDDKYSTWMLCWSQQSQPFLTIYRKKRFGYNQLRKMTEIKMAHLTLAFGLLGNIVSFMVFLAPIPTFYKIYKKKSTEGFQSAPYVVGLFSAMLWIYYAFLKTNVMLLITINSVGCIIETLYICFFLFYAPKKVRMESLKLIILLVIVGFGLIVVSTQFLATGVNRGVIVGWICLVFSLCVFVAPLGVLRQVIKTKSVEYMPILLSVALTLSAVMWFFYGLLLGDFNIAIPNVLGFTFGIIQMILYFAYKNNKLITNEKVFEFEEKHHQVSEMEEQKITKDHKTIDVAKLSGLKCCDHAGQVAVEPHAPPSVPNHVNIEVVV
ncbi:hypothetical protein LXL04_009338 [Taraxacum kok-saghyz]